jgi:hypothetical protein
MLGRLSLILIAITLALEAVSPHDGPTVHVQQGKQRGS